MNARTHWEENKSRFYVGFTSLADKFGGLSGSTGVVACHRHEPWSCEPGFWSVGVIVGSEVFDMFNMSESHVKAVQDDFGNLVVVP